jgi:SAM-dependent methyltransferase
MDYDNQPPEPEFTGERVVPGKTPPFLVLEHLVRYRFAARLAAGLKALDMGCGTGYGTHILGETASLTFGIDNDRETVLYARKTYGRANLRYAVGDCRYLPFASETFGLVVSFEVIEHIREQDQCLGEIQRVLSPDGKLIVSTPNALRQTKVIEEANPFHHKELTEDEFKDLLGRHFDNVQMLYQHEFSASGIQSATPEKGVPVEVIENFAGKPPAKYFVAICGVRPTKLTPLRGLGVGGIEHQIAIIQDVRQAQKEIDALLLQREANQREYSENLAAHRQEIESLKKETVALLAQRAEREEVIRRLEEHTSQLEKRCTEQRTELDWLYRWIPLNKVARRLLFGRHLWSRLGNAFRSRS